MSARTQTDVSDRRPVAAGETSAVRVLATAAGRNKAHVASVLDARAHSDLQRLVDPRVRERRRATRAARVRCEHCGAASGEHQNGENNLWEKHQTVARADSFSWIIHRRMQTARNYADVPVKLLTVIFICCHKIRKFSYFYLITQLLLVCNMSESAHYRDKIKVSIIGGRRAEKLLSTIERKFDHSGENFSFNVTCSTYVNTYIPG